MKKFFASFVSLLLLLASVFTFASCDFGDDLPSNTDYNADVSVVAPEDVVADTFIKEDDATYYTSPGLQLWMEVNGAYFTLEYFTLDGNKRIYDNVYLYERDYFYMITDDFKGWYASLSDPSGDSEFAEEEREDGYDVQINVKKSGIYKLVFDVDTLKFDMEYKSEITTPKYYPIKNCSIYTEKTSWVEMSVNPNDENEFVINNFNVGSGDTVSFFNYVHTSWFKVIVDESCLDKLASGGGKIVTVNVGGIYNVYINKNTYVVRFELTNPDSATYSCLYFEDGDFAVLTPYDENQPHIFRRRLVVDRKYKSVPDFYSAGYATYALTVLPSDYIISSDDYHNFKQVGTYDIIVNLKTFEISIELIPE